MGVIEIRDLSDEALEKLKSKAAQSAQSLEDYLRETLEDIAEQPPRKRRVVYGAMNGKLGAFKDFNWDAENTDEIEAWESSTLP